MSYKDKDMLFDIVDVGDEGLKPFIRPQHWSEDDNEWKTTGVDEPMPVVLKDNDEIFDKAIEYFQHSTKKYIESNRAVNTLQKLIDESE